MAWNAVLRWWTWALNVRRPLPWIVYDHSGAPSTVFCVVQPDTRGRLAELSTAAYAKAYQEAAEKHHSKIQKDVEYARKYNWAKPKQLTEAETKSAILQSDTVKRAQKGLIIARQADHVTRGATETWLPPSAFQQGNKHVAPFSGYTTVQEYVLGDTESAYQRPVPIDLVDSCTGLHEPAAIIQEVPPVVSDAMPFDWEAPILSAPAGGVNTVNGVFDHRLTQQLFDESIPSSQPTTDGRNLGVYVGTRMNTPRVFIQRSRSAMAEDLALHPADQESWLDINTRMDSLLEDMSLETGVGLPTNTADFHQWFFAPMYSEAENRPADLASYLASVHETTITAFRQASLWSRERSYRRSTFTTLPRGSPMLIAIDDDCQFPEQ